MSITQSLDNAEMSQRRIFQLIAGILCMVMVANLQYGWTYFVDPMVDANKWTRAEITVAFTIFIATETWLVPIEGWFVDRFGPRIVIAVGGVLVAIAWAINSVASSLPMLYLGAVISGIGAGAVYGTCVGNALKWFPDRRGLAAGFTAAGFGAGAAGTVIPIITVITTYGYRSAFLWFGLGQGLIVLLVSQFLRAPKPGETPAAAPRLSQSRRDFQWYEMLTSPVFYVLYVMFVLVASSGLFVTAQLASLAKDYGIANTSVNMLFVTSTVLYTAGIVDNILNGLARPTFGWVSDKIGRENTMAIVFTAGAGAYWALGTIGNTPYLFIITAGLVYFTWGEIYSLFPATCTDTYGAKYATTNAGLLYTAKGTSSLLLPLAAYIATLGGGWHAVFIASTIANLVVAAAALLILKPMRRAHLAKQPDTASVFT